MPRRGRGKGPSRRRGKVSPAEPRDSAYTMVSELERSALLTWDVVLEGLVFALCILLYVIGYEVWIVLFTITNCLWFFHHMLFHVMFELVVPKFIWVMSPLYYFVLLVFHDVAFVVLLPLRAVYYCGRLVLWTALVATSPKAQDSRSPTEADTGEATSHGNCTWTASLFSRRTAGLGRAAKPSSRATSDSATQTWIDPGIWVRLQVAIAGVIETARGRPGGEERFWTELGQAFLRDAGLGPDKMSDYCWPKRSVLR